jgi:hypothetical protein
VTAGKRWAGEERLPAGRPGERRQGFRAFTGPPRCLRTCGLHARQYPGRWAMAEYNLGVALHSQAAMAVAPDNTRLEFLTRAVAAFTATLDGYTPETAPADPPSSARGPPGFEPRGSRRRERLCSPESAWFCPCLLSRPGTPCGRAGQAPQALLERGAPGVA